MRIIEGFKISEYGDGTYVAEAEGELQEKYPQKIQMGISGAFLWDYLTRGEDVTRKQLIDKLGNFFENGAEEEKITADVDLFLDFMRKLGILVE